mgnify:CR=1 FL=1
MVLSIARFVEDMDMFQFLSKTAWPSEVLVVMEHLLVPLTLWG